MSETSRAPGWRIWAWRLVCAAAAATGLGIWHVSLLWIQPDRPWILTLLLVTAFGLAVAGRAIARGIPVPQRTALMRAGARLDGIGLIFLACLLLLLLLFHVGFERAASDGRSYFVILRSAAMDRDFDLANDEAQFGGVGSTKYPLGAPLLWSPFYGLAHLWLTGLNAGGGDWLTDGYYYPYQRAIGLASLFYGFAGLVLVYRVLRRYFTPGISALATLGVCGTSFFLPYLFLYNSMVHGVSMFATTLFLFLWHRHRLAPSTRHWLWLGAAAGIMATVRWQDGVFALLPVLDWIWHAWRNRPGRPIERLGALGRDLAIFAAAAFVAFSPQLVYWKAVFGTWVHLPAQEHGFAPGLVPPFTLDVLFSSNRGLLSWTPVITLSLVGLAMFVRRHWQVGTVLLAGFLGQVWVNGAVEIWWGGVGFGARRFSNAMLVFAVGLARLLVACERVPLAAPAVALAALLGFNLVFVLGYRDGRLTPDEGVTFTDVMQEVYERVGNPFSLPMGAYLAWRYDVGPSLYDRQRGHTYNNLDIDVGGPDDDRFLGRGWSTREGDAGSSFRWSDAATSTVLVPLKSAADDYVVEIEWRPFRPAGFPPQEVTVEVNGTIVGTARLESEVQTDRVRVPAAALRTPYTQIRFRYGYTVAPRAAGASADARPLGVAVSTIRLLRQVGP